jgi:hypothetical protein
VKFDNQEPVEYNDPHFGKGKGVVCGVYKDEAKDIELYVIYPKHPFDKSFWPYMTIVLTSNKIISTPF